MSELYVGHAATLPGTLDLDLIPMRVVQTSPLLVREESGIRDLAVYNGVPNWVHVPGDAVLVRTSTMTVIATLANRPQSAVVTGVSGTLVTVTASGLTWLVRAIAAPTVADTVAIAWGSEGGVVIGTIAGTIPTPTGTLPADLPSTGGAMTSTFRPSQSGTYRSGSRRGDAGSNLYQGHWIAPNNSNDNLGIWCYGDAWGAVRAKTVLAASITVQRGPRGSGVDGAVPVHLRLHNELGLPAGTPTLLAAANDSLALAPGQADSVDVTSMVQEIADNNASGFAVTYAGTSHYAMFLGAGASDSGVLSVTVL
jgi:hypothetical protein